MRRWLERKSVNINDTFPGPKDTFLFVDKLILFPNSQTKAIVINEDGTESTHIVSDWVSDIQIRKDFHPLQVKKITHSKRNTVV